MPPGTGRVVRVIWLVMVICGTARGQAIRPLGDFSGLKLFVDTQIETPQVNHNVTSAPLMNAGGSVEIQLFVPETAGKQTFGYNLEFDNTGNIFTDNFNPPSGASWSGAPLTLTPGEPVLTALLIGLPIVPDNGYIGSVILQARQDIAGDLTVRFKEVTMADPSRDNDRLDTAGASITFTAASAVEVIPGDLDLDGDVDFTDFLTFAGNFGKTGPVPIGGGVRIRTVVVHDTVTIGEAVKIDQLLLAQRLVLTTDSGTLDTLLVRTIPIQTVGLRAEAADRLELDLRGQSIAGTEYRNSLYGYGFIVPQGWTASEDPEDRSGVTLTRTPGGVIVAVATPNTENVSISSFTDFEISVFELVFSGAGGITDYQRVSLTDGTLGRLPSKEIVFTGTFGLAPTKGQMVLSADSGFIYVLLYIPIDSGDYDLYLPAFDTIKTTFKSGGSSKPARLSVSFSPSGTLKETAERLGLQLKNR